MANRPHGTRARYRAGCACTPCRAANSAYWTRWRQTRKAGRLPLGALVPAAAAHCWIRQLKVEWKRRQTKDLAPALGRHHDLARLTQQDMISLRMFLRIKRFYRERIGDKLEQLSDRAIENPHGLEN